MNAQDLIGQFVQEARECLERIGQRLLMVERDPANRELLNDLFREVHTLKGNCGLFDFAALEHLVHAGEDVLDGVRSGRFGYSPELADVLLDAMDHTAAMVEQIACSGQLDGDDAESDRLARALRRLLPDTKEGQPHDGTGSAADAAGMAAPPWLVPLPPEQRPAGAVAVTYTPEAECYFKGEDPWRLVRQAPGLCHLGVQKPTEWEQKPEAFDCYRHRLVFELVCSAPIDAVRAHFRYVNEQVRCHVIAGSPPLPAPAAATPARPATEPSDLLRLHAHRLWTAQRELLSRPGITPASVAAARQVLTNLVQALGGSAELQSGLAALPPGAAPLAAWASRHEPEGTGEGQTGQGDASQAGARRAGPAASPGAAGDDAGTGERNPRTLKVSQDKIDRLMDLIGEMVVAKNALPYLAARAETQFGQRELAREIKTQYSVINRIAEDMQHAVLQVRMLPVGTVFQRFGRLVRDISRKLGKEVELVLEGEDTEADKNVIESLADPLIHILRNSLDHGIELPEVRRAAGKPATGTLRVTARQEGDRVVLEMADDGAGIDTGRVKAKAVERGLIPAERADALGDAEAVQLVFLPGFSTADSISDLSGRGVGMDVVRTAVERVNGTVDLSSTPGAGTTIRLSLPLSMAVTHVMMIESAGKRFGVPMDLIVETVRVSVEDIHRFKQAQTVVLRGRIVPLRSLNAVLGLPEPQRINNDGEHAVLVVRLGGETIGLIVDDFDGTSDIILKPLEGVLAGLTGFAGTALMGDGSVLMILNPRELV